MILMLPALPMLSRQFQLVAVAANPVLSQMDSKMAMKRMGPDAVIEIDVEAGDIVGFYLAQRGRVVVSGAVVFVSIAVAQLRVLARFRALGGREQSLIV